MAAKQAMVKLVLGRGVRCTADGSVTYDRGRGENTLDVVWSDGVKFQTCFCPLPRSPTPETAPDITRPENAVGSLPHNSTVFTAGCIL